LRHNYKCDRNEVYYWFEHTSSSEKTVSVHKAVRNHTLKVGDPGYRFRR
jgi:hypothetical protein